MCIIAVYKYEIRLSFAYFGSLYQVRCALRVSPRLAVQVETCIPEPAAGQLQSASVVGGAGASRVFQIMYRNEEVILRDVIVFRAHILGTYMRLLDWDVQIDGHERKQARQIMVFSRPT